MIMGVLAESWRTYPAPSRHVVTGVRLNTSSDRPKATRGAPCTPHHDNGPCDKHRLVLRSKSTTEKTPINGRSRSRICNIPAIHINLIPPISGLHSIFRIPHAGNFFPEPLCSYSLTRKSKQRSMQTRWTRNKELEYTYGR